MKKKIKNFNLNSFLDILKHEQYVFMLGCIIGIIFFLGIYGYSRIIPWNNDWLMAGGDLTQHYLGWKAYLTSAWNFPLCLTDKLSYPITTSIMFTDSIPLWAVFFKIISPLLPSSFQYIGLFGIVTYALQGGFSALLLKKLNCSLLVCLIGTAILSFMPPFMIRMFKHTALASQWIILAALCLWFSDNYKFKHKHSYIVLWCSLAFITAGLHLYLSVMFCVILFGYCISLLIRHTKIKIVLTRFFLPLISIALSVYIFGGFSSDTNPIMGFPNYYTSNLISLFDSDGWSKFGWPNFSNATAGQGEGFAYLGLGIILLIIVSLFSLTIRSEISRTLKTAKSEQNQSFLDFASSHPNGISLFIIVIISLILGMGSTVTFLDKVLFSYPLPKIILNLWGIFRATGRFTWIAVYIISVFVIVFIEQNYKIIGKYLIIFALILQLIDLYPFSRVSRETACYNTLLVSPVWNEFSGYSHIYTNVIDRSPFQYAIAKYALERNMTINSFYFARSPKGMPYPFELSNDTLYIFSSAWDAFGMPAIYEIDDLYVSASTDTTGNFYQVTKSSPVSSILIYPNTPGMNIQNATLAEDYTLYTDGTDGIVLYGPYYNTKEGSYNFTLNYEVIENINSSPTVGIFDVCTNKGSNIIQSVEISSDQTSLTISEITFPDLLSTFEIRVHNQNGAKLKIISIEIS